MAKRATSTSASPETRSGPRNRVVVILGDDDMRRREALQRLRAELEVGGEPGDSELFFYDGKSASLADVLDEVRSYSLMQRPKLVVVDDADAFVSAHREALERYAQSPVDTATLVLRATRWNKGNLDKQIEKVGRFERCDAMRPAEAAEWLTERAQRVHRAKVDAAAIKALIERLGVNLALLDNELAKLAVAAGEGVSITAEMVHQIAGRASEEEAWRVQASILEILSGGRKRPLIEEVRHYIDTAGQPDVLIAYYVADLTRKFVLAFMLKRDGQPDTQIARELKFFGPGQFLLTKVLAKLTPRRAGQLFDRAMDFEMRSRSGRGDTMRNLECCCALLQDMVG